LRCGYRRFEAGGVAESGRSAVALDLLLVDFEDFVQS
jgi:hypothetical protein